MASRLESSYYLNFGLPKSPVVSKTFKMDPSTMDDRAFFKDWDRLHKQLFIDGQSIYERFKEGFDDLASTYQLESGARAIEPGLANALGSDAEDKRSVLQEKVTKFLMQKLGRMDKRLSGSIFWMFSQKALTTFYSRVSQACIKKLNGTYANGQTTDTCTLHISKKGVEIRTTSLATYRSFCRLDGTNQVAELQSPMQLKGHAVYTIGQKGKVEAAMEYALRPIRAQN
jgi:hypothetical protein